MTRLEKIRSMSAEELADYFCEHDDTIDYCYPGNCPYWRDDGTCAANGQHTGGQMAACREACIRYLNEEIADK